MSDVEPFPDVMELCALLQCLGFGVKSLDASDTNLSQDGGGGAGAGARTIVISCQASGINIVLDCPSLSCSCPDPSSQQNSGVWQVSGVAGGKQLEKEFGCTLLANLPKVYRDRLTEQLREVIRCIRQHGSELDAAVYPKDDKCASLTEIKTPEKILQEIQVDTPTRYRSLDTLTGKSATKVSADLPPPGSLRPRFVSDCEDVEVNLKKMVGRQSTYTLASTPGSVPRRNKTSSPIQASQNYLLDSLVAAQKSIHDSLSHVNNAIRKVIEETKDDSSISSLALDVSKISVLKTAEGSKAQFASSPNLSGISCIDVSTKSRLKRCESASTSSLGPQSANKGLASRFSRNSPNVFKREASTSDKTKSNDAKSKLHSLFKAKIAAPVRPKGSPMFELSTSLSNSAKKKYSHIKSTIPRPAKKD